MPQHIDMGVLPGLDIQTTIEKILEIRSKQVTTAQTEEKKILTKISAWGDISSSISTLTDALDALRSSDTWNKMDVTSSNTAAVQATATSSADSNTYDIKVTKLAQAHTVASSSAAALGISSSTDDLVVAGVLIAGQTFIIEGVTFTVGADEYGVTNGGTETLASLRTKINNAAADMDNEVSASIIDNRLVIARVETGDEEIVMSDPGAGGGAIPLQALGFLVGDETFDPAQVTRAAQAAEFTVNGLSVTRDSNIGLTDVLQNVTLNLYAETGSSTVSLDVAHDTATPKSAIESFIAGYNAAVVKLEEASSVTLNGSEDPTVGDLHGDTMIPTMLAALRRLATSTKAAYFTDADYTYNGRTGAMVSLQDVGVWTFGRDNRLSVNDEDRLDQMLSENFDKVQQLFQGEATPGVGYEHGVAGDLYTYCNNLSTPLSGEIAKHIFTLQESDADALEKINKMIDDIADQEEELWKQFTSMQDTISQMKADISWIGSSSSEEG